jgi:hypothetical protein
MSTLTDIYQILFGKNHIRDGDVIEMAEHGRAGGLSTGTPFNWVQEIPNKVILDQVDSNTIYIGEAHPGVLTSESLWRILKIVKDGSVMTIFFASSSDAFNKEWDERTSYTYA